MSEAAVREYTPRTEYPPALSAWLMEATRGLCEGARTRIFEEYAGHYFDHVDRGIARGLPEKAAADEALAALGRASDTGKKLRQTHFLEDEARWLEAFRTAWGHGHSILPDFVLLGLSVMMLIAPGAWSTIAGALFASFLGMSLVHPSHFTFGPVPLETTDRQICKRLLLRQSMCLLAFGFGGLPLLFGMHAGFTDEVPTWVVLFAQCLFISYAMRQLLKTYRVYRKLRRLHVEHAQ